MSDHEQHGVDGPWSCPVCGEGYPAGSPWIREPLFISDPVTVKASETVQVVYEHPEFAEPRTVRWLLVADDVDYTLETQPATADTEPAA